MATPLLEALEAGNWDDAKTIISEADDVPALLGTTDDMGNTPLYVALWHHAPEDLTISIMDLGPAAVKTKNKYEWTALHCACERGSPHRLIELLLRKFPDAVDMKNNEGDRPRSDHKKVSEESAALIRKQAKYIMDDLLELAETECTALRVNEFAKDATIASLKSIAEEEKAKAAASEAAFSEKIAALEAALREKDEALAGKDALLVEKDETYASLKASVEEAMGCLSGALGTAVKAPPAEDEAEAAEAGEPEPVEE